MATYTCTAALSPPAPSVTVTCLPTSSDSSTMTVEIDTANDSGFTVNLNTTTVTGRASGVSFGTSVGPFAVGSTVYVRARAGLAGTWSSYTATLQFTVPAVTGVGTQYLEENVGVLLIPTKDGSQNHEENIGVLLIPTKDGSQNHEENIGVLLIPTKDGSQNHELGDVNTLQPYPHLWSLQPWSGRPGDGVLILGQGMGSTRAQFAGVVQVLIGDTWTDVPVISWALVAPSADWGTPASAIEPATSNIDPEHVEIAIVVPAGAIPPGHQIRVRTTAP